MTELRFEHSGRELQITAERAEDAWRVVLPSQASYEIRPGADDGALSVLDTVGLDSSGTRGPERMLSLPCLQSGDSLVFLWKGRTYRFRLAARGGSETVSVEESGSVTAPNGGVVADVLVVEGQTVEAFEQIAIIEAMKVMTPVLAPRGGTVARLLVTRGQRIEQDAEMAWIEDTRNASIEGTEAAKAEGANASAVQGPAVNPSETRSHP